MIEISGLRKRFGRLHVLNGIDARVRSGRITAVIGPNGAGKSTLIKCVLGLVRPDDGDVRLDGRSILGDAATRARVGYMPQNPRVPDNLSAAELLELVSDIRRQRSANAAALVRAFALEGELDKPLRNLSGGTRQKVNAVLAFLFQPDVMVLDEPTSGLDPIASSTLKDLLLSERDSRATVVTSHILSEVEELADDVLVLLEGRVRFHGELHGLKAETRQPTLERAVARLMLRDVARGGGEAAA